MKQVTPTSGQMRAAKTAKDGGPEIQTMGINLHIPDTIVDAIRLPEERIAQELLVELAVALYAQGLLSLGKSRELAGMGKYDFGRLLGDRRVVRHYGREELEDDLAYARGQ